MADAEKIKLTQEGYDKLIEELSDRKTRVKNEISQRLEEARAQGDLSENSEYDEAKEAQAENEGRIKEIEALLKQVEIISEEEISSTNISLGSTFTLEYKIDKNNKEEIEYTLVNPNEEDIFTGKLSIESPVGKAVLGKKKGNVVDVPTPIGICKYKVIKIGK